MTLRERGPACPRRFQVLAWSVLAAVMLLLASLLQAVVSSGVAEAVPTTQAIDHRSPSTAALADGDDVRARFLVRLSHPVDQAERRDWSSP
jgi:hypothetical protein